MSWDESWGPAQGQKRSWAEAQGSQESNGTGASSKPLMIKYKGQEETPSDTLYLTGLPNTIDEDTLTQLFTGIGVGVQWGKIIPDALGTGYSAAMVQVGSLDEAETAIGTLKGQVVEFQGLAPPVKAAKGDAKGGKGGWCDGGKGSWDGGKGGWDGGKGGWDGGKAGWDGGKGAWDGGKGKGAWDGSKGKGGWDGGKGSWDGGKGSWSSWGGPGGWDSWAGPGGGKPSGKGKSAAPSNTATIKVVYAGREHIPSDNLYVSNLPTAVDQASLNQMFADLGFTVQQSRLIPDTQGWGVCAAMVRLASQAEAEDAIAKLHNQSLTVQGNGSGEGKGPDAGKAKGKGGKGKSGGDDFVKALKLKYAGAEGTPSETLYMTGVPSVVDEGTLTQIFAGAGCTVTKCKIIPDQWGCGYSAAMATVGSIEEAAHAISALNGQVVEVEGASAESSGGSWGAGGSGDGSWSGADGCGSWGGGGGGGDWGGAGGGGSWNGKGGGKSWSGANAGAGKAATQPPKGVSKGDQDFVKPLMLKYAGKEGTPSENLYMTGVPSAIDDAALVQIFAGVGCTAVKTRIISDQWGCGYSAAMASLASAEEAAHAIASLSGQVVQVQN